MTLIVDAPGRVNLIGEHTDYAGGLVLPMALERRVVFTGAADAARVCLRSEALDDTIEIDLTSRARSPDSAWGRRVAAVVDELAALGREPVGLDGVVSGDLPVGAGLGSSGAFGVALARALCDVAGLRLEPMELALACRRAEEQAVGVPCGILDQAAAVLGRPGHALFLDCSTLEYNLLPMPAGIAVLVVDSGVRRRVADTAYAQRRAELEAGHPARVRHVRTENERVRAVVEALEDDDRPALAELFATSQASLRDDYEVSTPELDRLVDEALAAGAFAARLTGAGFGGCIVALAAADRAPSAIQALRRTYVVWPAGEPGASA